MIGALAELKQESSIRGESRIPATSKIEACLTIVGN